MRTLFFIGAIYFLIGCTASKKSVSSTVVIEGSYKIVEREANVNDQNASIVGTVYDKEKGTPIKGAIVQIENLKKGVFTDELGNYSLEISDTGSYEIQVVNGGNTSITTKSIKLESKTKMEIVFYLGTIKEY